ncbi:MAG: peptide-modifying radical SAM enzyme CbpB [Magnetococcales bacterium]|nr:peptide-modifying radical SAM enzyme CbpB [Magnetococcales bacterium]
MLTTVHTPVGQPATAGRFCNTGYGPSLMPLDIGHPDWMAILGPETAFWSLVRRERLADALADPELLLESYRERRPEFQAEMDQLRFGLQPSAVYFNATDRCNLDCTYCYIPGDLRRHGAHMSGDQLLQALARLKEYFATSMGETTRKPRIIFHGAEPLLNRAAIFPGIDAFHDDFQFGIQTNSTLLDAEAIDFLTTRAVSIGLSLDGPEAAVTDRTRTAWNGDSVHAAVLRSLERLADYPALSVITTVTTANLDRLLPLVDLLHEMKVPACLLNPVRCTLPGARTVKPDDRALATALIAALERTHVLYRASGRKLIVANYANILLAILAPTARRLMCDISPCGGGRAFFAVAASGDLFPCSEFIGLEAFRGGNLFQDGIANALQSAPFKLVTGRDVERFAPCNTCAIRHYCGSPCPAEAHEMNGAMERTGAFCALYEELVRHAFRVIADGREGDFLWEGWDAGTTTLFAL